MNELLKPNDVNAQFNDIAFQNPDLKIGDTAYGSEFAAQADQDFYNSFMSFQQMDVLTDIQDPKIMEAVNAYNLTAETLSLEGLTAEINRREEAQVVAFRQQMDRHVIDNYIDSRSSEEDEDHDNVTHVPFGKPSKPTFTKAA
jgi:hypothetical protein